MNAVDANRYRYQCKTENNTSFSSTLLDIIYRSIDEKDVEEPVMYRKPLVRRKTSADFKNNSIRNDSSSFNFNSNNDSRYRSRLQSTTEYAPKPRPIRTSNECKHQVDDSKADSNYTKTKKTKTMMKLYSYLNKGKQPISPGGRITTFLISLFTTTNTKKSKISSPCNGGDHDAIIHTNTKSKTKTKTAKNDSNSVRFYPTSLFIDESIHVNSVSINERVKNREMEETRKNLVRNYLKNVAKDDNDDDDDDDDDDDNVSCISSDLFELDHLSAMQELPLYETTSIDVNRAIANGLVL